MAERFHSRNRNGFAEMTLDEAHIILTGLAELEFPTIFSTAVFFALFKTYGIPSISRLLVDTGQLANPTTSSKRAADTSVILVEVVLNKPNSKRCIDGISRMNYLHDGYRKAGKISDGDMLYTLSLFALEAPRWTSRYEWRQLTDLELCAVGTFWKDMGDAMQIPYAALESSKPGWKHGLQWLKELEEWSLKYEEANMLPYDSNRQLAVGTFDLLLSNIPRRWRRVVDNLVITLLEPRLRGAMMLPKPATNYYIIVNSFMMIRRFLLCYLALPRPFFMRKRIIPDAPNPVTGRFNARRYRLRPWYVKPTISKRWGPKAWWIWMNGGVLPGDDGDKFHPEGYIITEVGPESKKGKGEKQMSETQSKLLQKNRGGCPF